MKRRKFITLLGGAAAWPLTARAQQVKAIRVGATSVNLRSTPFWSAFERRLDDLGNRDGQKVVLEFLQVESTAQYPDAMRELVRRGADILVAQGPEVLLKAAIAATRELPIIMIAIDYDPLARGYVTGLARPTGNVTGIFFQQIELSGKRLELAREMFPDLQSVVAFWDADSAEQWRATKSAAEALGLRVFDCELRGELYDYEGALGQVAPEHRRVPVVMTSPRLFFDRARFAAFALQHRLPAIFVFRDWVEAGGLISYGTSITALFRRAADYVHRIAQGERPAQLPVEQPTKFELVVNLRTAKAIGLTLPPTLLARADEVIE